MKYYKDYLTEIKLARVFKHFKSDPPVAIMSAFRDDQKPKANLVRNKQLASSIKKAGFGYVYVDGVWQEKQADGSIVPVKEDSIMIIGQDGDGPELKKLVMKMIKKYNQDGALLKDEGSQKIGIIDQQGKIFDIGAFSANKIGDNYTQLRGGGKDRTFVFEEVREGLGWAGRVVESKQTK